MGSSAWFNRLLLWICGGWFFLTISIGYVAIANFSQLQPQRLPAVETALADVMDAQAQATTLRYVASELNRHFFSVYGWANLTLAAAALVLVSTSGRMLRWRTAALAVCFGIAALGALYLTPTLIDLGRQIDFLPREPAPDPVRQFYRLHRLSEGLELLKLVLLTGVSVSLVRAGP
ncbi:MAG: hypothetical protein ACFCVA_15380 [Gammaproteobacteria bacterium]